MKCENDDVPVLANNVKMTASLVATAGSALLNYPHGTSRELQRRSGTHFSSILPRSAKDDKTKLKLDREVGGGCFFLFPCLALFH